VRDATFGRHAVWRLAGLVEAHAMLGHGRFAEVLKARPSSGRRRSREEMRSREEDMAKDQSDIFICRLKKDDYRAYPSPFVAHGGGTEIQLRNLTDDAIEVDLRDAPVHRKTLSLVPRAADYVVVNGDARAGLYEYGAAVGRAKKAGRASRSRRVLVKGGSSPKIIIDT
jgi:hypothetical protein